MEEFRTPLSVEPKPKPKRKKHLAQPNIDAGDHEMTHPLAKTTRPAKKASSKVDRMSPLQEAETFAHDPSMPGEYRTLRRRYLLLEEESLSLDRELGEVSDTIKTLEDEKFALLDRLVVLEGLVDPSDIQPTLGE
ncbi:uncharacterized protein LOC144712624 [Wolffia australiana]